MSSDHKLLYSVPLGSVERRGFYISNSRSSGLSLFMRSLLPREEPSGRPVLFVHGATLASYLWDIDLAGHSMMEHMAREGRRTYAVDIRGYGGSDKPPEMDREPGEGPPLVRGQEALEDIDQAVEFIRTTTGSEKVDLVGGSWGSITSGMYASGPGAGKVRRLVLYAPIFCTPNQDWLEMIADPESPERVNPNLGSFRWVTEEEVRRRWDKEIPLAAKDEWRPEQSFKAIVGEALKWDPRGAARNRAAFRAPNGTLVDLFEAFSGRPLYRPEDIRIPTLLIRGADDPTSTDPDAKALFDKLGSQIKRYVVVGHGSHFIVAEKNRWQLFSETRNFLDQPELES